LYSSPRIIRIIKSRRMWWAGHVARMEKNTNAYRLLVGTPEGKRPLGRPRRRWLDNIRIGLERWDGVMLIGLVWLFSDLRADCPLTPGRFLVLVPVGGWVKLKGAGKFKKSAIMSSAMNPATSPVVA
jgi:hypothetical protein